MNFLYGASLSGITCALLVTIGYGLAGFISSQSPLIRVAIASQVGLAWVVLCSSVLGAIWPLGSLVTWITWLPILLIWITPTTRNQLIQDAQKIFKSSSFPAALGGLTLLWLALLLPFLIYPDLAFFDGRPNHDNFFWSIAGEYLQHHNYLTPVEKNRSYPLFNMVESIIGLKPAWGRMGAEGYLALTSSMWGRTPIELYNFLVCTLVIPWTVTVLAIARHFRLQQLNRASIILICFCQPILFFFIANGNLPNLFGAIFGGGLWLIILLACETKSRARELVIAGALVTHGVLCCYPEILPFSLIPVGLLVVWHYFRSNENRLTPFAILAIFACIGLALNPLTTIRAWSGFWNSIDQVKQDISWTNIFSPLTTSGYAPALVTLSIAGVRVYGFVGGLVATIAILISFFLVIKHLPRRDILLISLSGFGAMVIYTLVTSFGYGWQKSAQFFGVALAVLFPTLLVGAFQDTFGHKNRRIEKIAFAVTFVVIAHGMISNVLETLKSASYKGVTAGLLQLHEKDAQKLAGVSIYIDGATFRSSFFHSMWSARIFKENPIIFFNRQEQAGGYLRGSVEESPTRTTSVPSLYYVSTDWARSFDYESLDTDADRIGVLLEKHNLVTESSGFYRTTGVPQRAKEDFSLTIYPYEDGWLELTLQPLGNAKPDCRLEASATTKLGATVQITSGLDANQHLHIKFPLKANSHNVLTAHIFGAPEIDLKTDDPPYQFRVLKIKCTRKQGFP